MKAIKQGMENELESNSPSPLGAYSVIDSFLELAPWHVGIFVRERELMGIMGVSISLVWSIVAAVNGTFVSEQQIVSAVVADCGLKVGQSDMSKSFRGYFK